MNPNYFYDLAYTSPHRSQMYEYSQHDSENRVDFATFYNEDMWTRGLLTDDSRTLLDTYHAIPKNGYPNTKLGLEWDCGSVKPALFARFHAQDVEINNSIYTAVSSVVGLSDTEQPRLPNNITAEDVGIYPERGGSFVRYLVRGEWGSLLDFARSHGATGHSELPVTMRGATIWNTGISFDWNGIEMSNFTLHSSELERDNPWVKQSLLHCRERVTTLLDGGSHTVSQFVKIGLSNGFASNYMKAYFTVRW